MQSGNGFIFSYEKDDTQICLNLELNKQNNKKNPLVIRYFAVLK